MPPVHWQLHTRWSDLPTIVQEARSFILKDMLARWDIRQLHTEMINISGLNLAAYEEEDNDSQPPAKKPALTSEEDDFNLLFGQKEDSEAEGQVQSDDHLQHIQHELERYLKEAEINFRKDGEIMKRTSLP